MFVTRKRKAESPCKSAQNVADLRLKATKKSHELPKNIHPVRSDHSYFAKHTGKLSDTDSSTDQSDDSELLATMPKPELRQTNPFWSKNVEAATITMWYEAKRREPDVDLLKKLMKLTFPYRKHEYEQRAEISKMLQDFPVLRDYRFLKGELRLFLKVRWSELDLKLEEKLEEYHRRYKYESDLQSDAVIDGARQQLKLNGEDEELSRDLQLLGLGFVKTNGKLHKRLYRERHKENEPFLAPASTPSIDINGTLGREGTEISVWCEGSCITKTPNFYEAAMCCYSIHWLFNLVYMKHCKKLFEFFDWLIGE